MFDMSIVEPDDVADAIPSRWNHLERHEVGVTSLVHYTLVDTQPWKNDRNPLAPLWESAYADAVASGAVDPVEVRRLAAAGLVKRSLLQELVNAPRPPRRAPMSVVYRDARRSVGYVVRPLRRLARKVMQQR